MPRDQLRILINEKVVAVVEDDVEFLRRVRRLWQLARLPRRLQHLAWENEAPTRKLLRRNDRGRARFLEHRLPHRTQYNTAARIRKGTAPLNLMVPNYEFTSDTVVTIG